MPPTATPYCHFERMREIFFVRGQAKVGGQREAGNTVLLKTCNHGVSRKLIHAGNRKRKRSLGSARDNDTRVRFPHVSFHPAAEANLRPIVPSFQRKEGTMRESPFPQKGYKKTQPLRAALSDFKNYTLKRK